MGSLFLSRSTAWTVSPGNRTRSSAIVERPRDTSLNISLSNSRWLEVIHNGTIRKLGYGFLFTFHNYGSILYYFRDKARYWSKITIFHTPCIQRLQLGVPSEYYHSFVQKKCSGYPTVVASPGFCVRKGTACMFTKSDRNHRTFYVNIIRWR